MTATAAQIGFVTSQFRSAVASDSSVKTAYGEKARDSADDKSDPIVETFLEDPADAQVIANERLTLLSADRRRFRQDVNKIIAFTGTLDFSQVTPAVTVIDDDRQANHAAAIVEIGVRFGDNKTSLVTWG